jgi:hypothetical protein
MIWFQMCGCPYVPYVMSSDHRYLTPVSVRVPTGKIAQMSFTKISMPEGTERIPYALSEGTINVSYHYTHCAQLPTYWKLQNNKKMKKMYLPCLWWKTCKLLYNFIKTALGPAFLAEVSRWDLIVSPPASTRLTASRSRDCDS